jgi:nicotinamidase-related amidase
VTPESPLRPGQDGNRFKDCVHGTPDLLVAKTTNSAFLGEPDLDQWLSAREVAAVAVCGIQTNMCCETTARMAANLGYRTLFVLDATHTFGLRDLAGNTIPAAELSRVTAANLSAEFAEVVMTRGVLAS